MSSRLVALIDMDCFYVQVEQRLNPELKNKPVAVVQYNKWKGGGIIAVNYEARAFGVTRSMRGNEAKEKCPDIALVHVPEKRGKADISKYRDAGREVVDVLCQYSKCVERASVDEAYLDLTQAVEHRISVNKKSISINELPTSYIVGFDSNINIKGGDSEEMDRKNGVLAWLEESQEDKEKIRLVFAAQLVEEIRAAVYEQTGYRCSAGIAHNKILSKLVCGLHKPNRQTVLPFSQVPHLYATLPVRKVKSLGGKMGDNLVQTLGVSVMADLERFSEAELCQKFDHKNGSWLYNIARGIDNDPVTPRLIPKSIGCCKRFPGGNALSAKQKVEFWVTELAKEVSERLYKDLEENHRRALSMTVQWSLEAGGSSCSKTGALSSYEASSIAAEAIQMLSKANNAPSVSSIWKPPLQFLGINVGKFTEEENKNVGIQKFFKAKEKSDTTVHNNLLDAKASVNNDELHDSNSKSNNASGGVKSFFLNYGKRTELADDSEETIPENSKEFTFEEKQSYDNELPISKELVECSDKPKDCKIKFVSDSFLYSPGASTSSLNSTNVCDLAPCPQCEKMVLIVDMSEHLDHHVAQDLHNELNSTPNNPPREFEPVSKSISNSSNTQPNKKRKYTKSSAKNTKDMKGKGIAAFFHPQ